MTRADLHSIACQQFAVWLATRSTIPDEELWAGLRDRFLRFGYVIVDGTEYGGNSASGPTPEAVKAALQRGTVQAHGNLHWTNLARSVGSERDDTPAIRAAIEYLLDESVPFADRISSLAGGPRQVRGFGISHWTALYAMASGWKEPAVNRTVSAAYERLGWPLEAQSAADRVAEVASRGRKLLDRSRLESLSDIDWVYWRVTQEAAEPTKPDPEVVVVPSTTDTTPTLQWLVERTLWTEEDLEDILDSIQTSSP